MWKLFVTGAPRSGTTLADKLLSMHPRLLVHSQPLPLLYVHLKQAFINAGGNAIPDSSYPLNDMFLGNHYSPEDFTAFLQSFEIDVDLCARVLRQMIPYSGQYTKPADPLSFVDGYRACGLHDFVLRYCATLNRDVRSADVLGAKESFCEEFIPYFLTQGTHVLHLLRDPRDSIASMTYGTGRAHSGRPRPHLFNIRQWRKSAAFAFEHSTRMGYRALRYEDLVRDPHQSLDEVVCGLDLERYTQGDLAGPLRTQAGVAWTSNSSHRPTQQLDPGSVGRHREMLPPQVCKLIEACCFHEMRALGYEPEIAESDIEAVLAHYHEDLPLHRVDLAEYRWSTERAREEQMRLEAIAQLRYDPRLFIFPQAFETIAS